MKAKVSKQDPEKLYIDGVELDFNCLNENHQRKLQEVGGEVAKEYPNAMNLMIMSDGRSLDTLATTEEDAEAFTKKLEDETKAIVMFFTEMFGEEKAKEILSESPYFKKCHSKMCKFQIEMIKQGNNLGVAMAKEESELATLLQSFVPVGEKGAPKE